MGRDRVKKRLGRDALPELTRLHERHRGVTKALAEAMAESAAVALSRHHSSPADFRVSHDATTTNRQVRWEEPSDRTQRAHGNTDDATEAGAYSIALATVETELGLYAIARTDVRTGADYYVGPPETDELDLEEALRLEVSGVDAGDESVVAQRLRKKVKQTTKGQVDVPALACVVGFAAKRIVLERAETE